MVAQFCKRDCVGCVFIKVISCTLCRTVRCSNLKCRRIIFVCGASDMGQPWLSATASMFVCLWFVSEWCVVRQTR